MSTSTHIRQPSTSSSTLPRASHRPLPSSSSSINISSPHPQLTSNATPSASQHKEEFKLPTARSGGVGGARKVSAKQLGSSSNSSRTNEIGSIGSVRGPRRVLQGVQETTGEQRGLRDTSKSTGDQSALPQSQSSSIRPPSSSRAALRPATTPLRRSQLSQSVSRSTLDEKEGKAESTRSRPPSQSESNVADSFNTSRSLPISTAGGPATSRRTVSGTPSRRIDRESATVSPRSTRRVPPSPSVQTSTSRKPSSSSLLNRSMTSSTLSRSTSSRTSLQPTDSPLKRSTTTTRLPPSSSSIASIRPPRPPLSRLPTSTSSITKLSSIPQSSSRQLDSKRVRANEGGERLKGLGPPPVARRVSVSQTRRGSNAGANGGTPRSRKMEDMPDETRDGRERRESWETVGSNRSSRPSLDPSSLTSTTSPPGSGTNPFSTPSASKHLSTSTSTSLAQIHLDPTPRQISLLRSSTTATKRKPRGSTTLEELLASGLFSSPLPSTPTGISGIAGGGGGGSFELMDEEISRVMLEEIGGVSSPWRGRVVSLNMSKRRSPRRVPEQERGDVSFEPDMAEEVEEEEEEERREVLVLERMGQEELRREKEELEEKLRVVEEEKEKDLREMREELENRMRKEREKWERERKEFERNLAELVKPQRATSEFELGLSEAKMGYERVQSSCEGIEKSAMRERDELVGMMESLKVVGKGLEIWRSMC